MLIAKLKKEKIIYWNALTDDTLMVLTSTDIRFGLIRNYYAT